MRREWLLGLAVLALVGLSAPAAFAETAPAAKPQPVPIQITMKVQPQKDGKVTLSATATTAGGAGVPDLTLAFTAAADFMGKRTLPVGSAKTDSAGTALSSYHPDWDGPHQFQVSFAGNDAYTSATATASADLKSLKAPYVTAPADLASFRHDVGLGVLGATVAVWAVLLGVVAIVAAGVAMAAKKHRSSGHAPAAD